VMNNMRLFSGMVKMHHLNTDVFSNTSVKCDTVNRRKEEN
jgi:hypothetical protein